MKLRLIVLFVACAAVLAPALAAKGDEFERRLTAFSKHWEQYGARRLALDSPVVKGLGRRLAGPSDAADYLSGDNKELLNEGASKGPNMFEMLIGGAQGTTSAPWHCSAKQNLDNVFL